jgi:hypothetical protein
VSGVQWLGRHSITWPDPIRGPWVIRFHWAVINGTAECVGLDVRSFRTDDADTNPRSLPQGQLQPVTSTLLRQINPGERIAEARQIAAELREDIGRQPKKWKASKRTVAAAKTQAKVFRAEPKRGRPPLPPSHFEEVARVYSEAMATNKKPTRAVQRHFRIGYSTAAAWVRRARDDDFLPPTSAGVATGNPPGPRRTRRKD